MRRAKPVLTTLPLVLIVLIASLLVSGGREGRAIQAPRISIDMDPAGNAYDAATNTMIAGPLDQCLGSNPPNNAGHNHIAHLIVHEVEDLLAWQARLHYDGGRMRPAAANVQPFPDDLRGQAVGFTNLPIAAGVHREISPASVIPPGAPGPQTALFGAAYQGIQEPTVSPDTPPKAPPDDISYAAPTGGVLASLTLQVLPGQAGQPVMSMDLDDASPTAPGTKVVIFSSTDTRTTDINLAETSLFDGFHAEGACVLPPGVQTPPPPAPGGPGGPGGSPGSSPGATNGANGGGTSPGAGTPGPGATGSPDGTDPDGSRTPTRTPDGDGSEDEEEDGGASDGEDGGTPVWPFILIAAVAVAAGAAAFAAWRYRARIPWLRDRFPS